MGNFTDITIRVPSEQADFWVDAIQNIEQNGVYYNDGYFVHPNHTSQINTSDAEWLNCEITKIRDRSKVFDMDCVKDVLGTVGDVLNVGTSFVNAISGACSK